MNNSLIVLGIPTTWQNVVTGSLILFASASRPPCFDASRLGGAPMTEHAATVHASAASWPRRMLDTNLGRLALITVLVFMGMSAAEPNLFFTQENFSSMAFQFPEFAILGLAVMVSMLTGGIDLSAIGLANLSSLVAVLVMRSLAPDPHAAHVAPAIALDLTALLGVGALGGLLNGFAIAAIGVPPTLATLRFRRQPR
jgi:ribose/xylose/arabinose/galactoside ABC-type transport system permease subunit